MLAQRLSLQEQIDGWHRKHPGKPEQADYLSFLSRIGYLTEPAGDFVIETDHVDREISLQAGPQLVVPVKNARFALNAANARWGSLYDALYGTDAIDEADGAQKGVPTTRSAEQRSSLTPVQCWIRPVRCILLPMPKRTLILLSRGN